MDPLTICTLFTVSLKAIVFSNGVYHKQLQLPIPIHREWIAFRYEVMPLLQATESDKIIIRTVYNELKDRCDFDPAIEAGMEFIPHQ